MSRSITFATSLVSSLLLLGGVAFADDPAPTLDAAPEKAEATACVEDSKVEAEQCGEGLVCVEAKCVEAIQAAPAPLPGPKTIKGTPQHQEEKNEGDEETVMGSGGN